MRYWIIVLGIVFVISVIGAYLEEVKADDRVYKTRALLVDNMDTFIETKDGGSELLYFAAEHGFNELTFYTGGPIKKRILPYRAESLKSIILNARKGGIKRIGIATGGPQETDRIRFFIDHHKVKIDTVWIEHEWWNADQRNFDYAVKTIEDVRAKLPKVKIGVYIGWVTKDEMHKLADIVDRIYIHTYVDSGQKTYPYLKTRLDLLNDYRLAPGRKRIQIMPIFSAEWRPRDICSQGPKHKEYYNHMCFMGLWLKGHDRFKGAEKEFNRPLKEDNPPLWQMRDKDSWRYSAVITGSYWFAYTFAKEALK